MQINRWESFHYHYWLPEGREFEWNGDHKTMLHLSSQVSCQPSNVFKYKIRVSCPFSTSLVSERKDLNTLSIFPIKTGKTLRLAWEFLWNLFGLALQKKIPIHIFILRYVCVCMCTYTQSHTHAGIKIIQPLESNNLSIPMASQILMSYFACDGRFCLCAFFFFLPFCFLTILDLCLPGSQWICHAFSICFVQPSTLFSKLTFA